MIKVLAITNLFPSSLTPTFAPFNKEQFISLARITEMRAIVPVPWVLAVKSRLKGERPLPPAECRGSIEVFYPTYFYTPKVLRSLYGSFYYHSIRTLFDRLVSTSRPDVVYATWAYPDCYAAAAAAKRWNIPVVARFHGSDVNEYLEYPSRRRRIIEVVDSSDAVVVVSKAMRDRLIAAGAEETKLNVVYNGIDRSLFMPSDKGGARGELGLDRDKRIILFAGNLKPVKGLDGLIRAVSRLDIEDVELHLLGSGPLDSELRSTAAGSGAADRIFFHGAVSHDMIPRWISASDLVVLPSISEGTPNIILEALACSRPVVASRVGGVPEIVSSSSGILFPPGDDGALRSALRKALEREWNEDAIECPASSWEENAEALLRIFKGVSNRNARNDNDE